MLAGCPGKGNSRRARSSSAACQRFVGRALHRRFSGPARLAPRSCSRRFWTIIFAGHYRGNVAVQQCHQRIEQTVDFVEFVRTAGFLDQAVLPVDQWRDAIDQGMTLGGKSDRLFPLVHRRPFPADQAHIGEAREYAGEAWTEYLARFRNLAWLQGLWRFAQHANDSPLLIGQFEMLEDRPEMTDRRLARMQQQQGEITVSWVHGNLHRHSRGGDAEAGIQCLSTNVTGSPPPTKAFGGSSSRGRRVTLTSPHRLLNGTNDAPAPAASPAPTRRQCSAWVRQLSARSHERRSAAHRSPAPCRLRDPATSMS